MTAPTATDRFLASFRQLVGAETAPMRFLGTYEYTVEAAHGSTVDVAPTDTTTGLPAMNGVALRQDSIAVPDALPGKLCHVVFVNGDMRKPVVTWVEPPSSGPTFQATVLGWGNGAGPVTGLGTITIASLP